MNSIVITNLIKITFIIERIYYIIFVQDAFL